MILVATDYLKNELIYFAGAYLARLLRNFEKQAMSTRNFWTFQHCIKKLWVPNKNLTYTQEAQYQNRKYATFLYQDHKELDEMILKECKTGKTSSLDQIGYFLKYVTHLQFPKICQISHSYLELVQEKQITHFYKFDC